MRAKAGAEVTSTRRRSGVHTSERLLGAEPRRTALMYILFSSSLCVVARCRLGLSYKLATGLSNMRA